MATHMFPVQWHDQGCGGHGGHGHGGHDSQGRWGGQGHGDQDGQGPESLSVFKL